MLPQIKSLIFAILVTLAATFSMNAQRGGPPPSFTNERFVIRAMAALNSAEATYSATAGSGNFGTLAQLRSAGLIDDALASGTKYGYRFTVTPSQTTYTATALPARYGKSGRYSYYIDQQGVLLGADKMGNPTDPTDGVYVDTCALWGIDDRERCTIQAMRTLHSAEMTFAATVGHGNYGIFQELHNAGLINWVLGVGSDHGYNFEVKWLAGPPATFEIWATPQQYGITGYRSFYVDQTGVVRGANHAGSDSGPDDPPVN